MQMINITVNSNTYQVPLQSTLNDMVTLLNITPNGIAIAINTLVIKKDDWNVTPLQENDTVLIIRSAQGG